MIQNVIVWLMEMIMTKTRIKVENVDGIETFIPQYRFMFLWRNFLEVKTDNCYVYKYCVKFDSLDQAKEYLMQYVPPKKAITYINYP